MKIDFSTEILDLQDNPIPLNFDGEGKPVGKELATLASVCCRALLATYPDEQSLAATQKVIRFKLACKITDGGEQDCTVEEITELKKLIGKAFAALVVGRAFEILDPTETPAIPGKQNGREKAKSPV